MKKTNTEVKLQVVYRLPQPGKWKRICFIHVYTSRTVVIPINKQ